MGELQNYMREIGMREAISEDTFESPDFVKFTVEIKDLFCSKTPTRIFGHPGPLEDICAPPFTDPEASVKIRKANCGTGNRWSKTLSRKSNKLSNKHWHVVYLIPPYLLH